MTMRAAVELLCAFSPRNVEKMPRPSLTMDDNGKLRLTVIAGDGKWLPLVFEDADLDARIADVVRDCKHLVAVMDTGAKINAASRTHVDVSEPTAKVPPEIFAILLDDDAEDAFVSPRRAASIALTMPGAAVARYVHESVVAALTAERDAALEALARRAPTEGA